MATTREIVKRRRSVANIRKITKTMEMIATAKFRRALNRAVGSKPYTEKIAELVSTLASGSGEAVHPLLEENAESNRVVLLVLTSNRGLCGGYNGNIIRMANHQIKLLIDSESEVELRVSGKKGISALRFAGHEIRHAYTDFDDKITFAQVEELASELIDLYCKKEIDGVRIVYTRFISSARHYAEVLNLLPLGALADEEKDEEEKPQISMEDYLFSPAAEEILSELIPVTVKTELFQCFMDAVVSEQVARMSAMKAATDNAQQMIQALTRQYNRVRQSQITGELLDIIGGAEAIK
jgi:F-type H+-transporting ATPase subunit gamma